MNPEVLIIGGGVIGLSIARELHKQGVKRITLLDKGRCGEEASWAAAGMLSPQTEADERTSFFDLCRASQDLYPDFADALLEETGVDVELDRAGTLYLAFTDEGVKEISRRFEWQREAGFSVEHLSAVEVLRAEPFVSTNVRESLFFPNDWQVENRKLIAALKCYAEINGIEIHEDTQVENLVVEGGRVVRAATNSQVFNADMTVIATGAWTSLIKLGDSDMPVKIEPVRGQIVAFQSETRLFQHVLCTGNGYIVPRRGGRILAGSTSENVGFDKSVTESVSRSLLKMAGEIVPGIINLEIADRWAGLRPQASDGLPVLGPFSKIDGLFMATGHYRNGILLAPLTAKLVAENLVNSKDSDYFVTFGANRFTIRGIGKGV
ncbi:MAG: glycine oxidase ThiO [Pyrinomonadaceae bacterium]